MKSATLQADPRAVVELVGGILREVRDHAAELLRDGRKIYGARVLTSTLEEVYVEAVGGETE